jgi:putative ABC transport system permease protein
MLAFIRSIFVRLFNFNRRRPLERMHSEIEFHLEMEMEDNLRQGMNPSEARRRALIALGGIDQTKEACHATGSIPWIEALIKDMGYTWRMFRRNPGFTAVAIVTLALGIGCTTSLFSCLNAIILKPLPYAEPDRIVRLMYPDGGPLLMSTLNYLDVAKQNTVFAYMSAQSGGSWTAIRTGVPEPLQVQSAYVSPGYFEIFGIKPLLGRTFVSDEDQPDKGNVVVLGHRVWETHFGADPGIVGRNLLLDDQDCRVIGILPAARAFDSGGMQIWRPLVFGPKNRTRNLHWLTALALLKRDVTLKQAQAQMNVVAAQLAGRFPEHNKNMQITVARYVDTLLDRDSKRGLLILMSAAGMVLLIGCVNIANLLLARASSRSQEVALRASLGAGRWRLIRQFLTESILLSFCGGIVGLGVGKIGVIALLTVAPPSRLPRETDISMIDWRVLLFTFSISILTGVLFGLAPALQAARPNLAAAIKEGSQGGGSGAGRRRLRSALVIAEIGLAFILLTCSCLVLRSFYRILHIDLGFDSTNVMTAGLPLTIKQCPDPVRLNVYLHEVQKRIKAVPGIQDVALTSALPLQGGGIGFGYMIEGRPQKEHVPGCFFKIVSPPYFRALGIRISRGRGLNEGDVQGASGVAVINKNLARQEFPNENPIGRRIVVPEIIPGTVMVGSVRAWEIVGVIDNEKISALGDEWSAGMYVSNEQSPTYQMRLIARSSLNPLLVERNLRAAYMEVSGGQLLTDVRTLDNIKSEAAFDDRILAEMLAIFAAVAMLLAAVGIYGVTSYSVAQRTREIGIRAALGAGFGQLLRMILRGGVAMTAIGLVLGAGGSYGFGQTIQFFLYGTSAHDPAMFIIAAVVLGFIALFACYVPARRAAKTNPAVALRYE